MLRLSALRVDYNNREVPDAGTQAVEISFGVDGKAPALERKMETGLRVILYDLDDRYEGVLRPGTWHPWVADLIPGTYTELTPEEFERLRAETLRAAEEIN